MAVTLYKKGNTHIIRGVECEIQNFPVEELQFAIDSGYVTSPDQLFNPPVDECLSSGEMSNKDIRAAAKDAGIENYKTKMIATLKRELGL